MLNEWSGLVNIKSCVTVTKELGRVGLERFADKTKCRPDYEPAAQG